MWTSSLDAPPPVSTKRSEIFGSESPPAPLLSYEARGRGPRNSVNKIFDSSNPVNEMNRFLATYLLPCSMSFGLALLPPAQSPSGAEGGAPQLGALECHYDSDLGQCKSLDCPGVCELTALVYQGLALQGCVCQPASPEGGGAVTPAAFSVWDHAFYEDLLSGETGFVCDKWNCPYAE